MGGLLFNGYSNSIEMPTLSVTHNVLLSTLFITIPFVWPKVINGFNQTDDRSYRDEILQVLARIIELLLSWRHLQPAVSRTRY
ncbi:hypothetical protein D3C76_102150 [compost metagenome]